MARFKRGTFLVNSSSLKCFSLIIYNHARHNLTNGCKLDKSTHSGFHSVNWAVYWAFKQSERFAFRKQNLVEESDPSVSVLPPFILTMSLGWVITQSYILCPVNKKWVKASLSDSFTAKNWIECFGMIRMWVSLSRSRFIFQFEAWMMNHRTV